MQRLLINPVLTLTGASTGTSANIDFVNADSCGIFLSPTGSSVTGTVNLQVSNDGTNFLNLGTAQQVSVTGGTNALLTYDRPQFHYGRLVATGITGGTLSLSANVLLKTDTPTR